MNNPAANLYGDLSIPGRISGRPHFMGHMGDSITADSLRGVLAMVPGVVGYCNDMAHAIRQGAPSIRPPAGTVTGVSRWDVYGPRNCSASATQTGATASGVAS